jgi:hypothetical protein
MTIKSAHLNFSGLTRFNDVFRAGKFARLLKSLDGMTRSFSILYGRLPFPKLVSGPADLTTGAAQIGWSMTFLADGAVGELRAISNLLTEACECPDGAPSVPEAPWKVLEALTRLREAEDSIRLFEKLFLSGEFDVRRF